MHAYATGSRTAVYGYLAVFAVVIALVLNRLADATEFTYGWLISAPSVGAAFAGLLGLFDTWAWRWQWLRTLGVTATPVVDGTYVGTIRSTYGNAVINVRVSIEQRWLRVLIRFEVLGQATSTSRSVAAAITDEGHKDARVTYTYVNQIRPGIADDDMRDHDGTAELVITPDGRATGRYFNARGRQGVLELTRAP